MGSEAHLSVDPCWREYYCAVCAAPLCMYVVLLHSQAQSAQTAMRCGTAPC
jgi:hypothetical protein